MYKITLYDKNCSPVCDGTTSFFTEDLAEFEKNWLPYASVSQKGRYERSKAGEIVTDYYSDDPSLNIVQEDKDAEIIFEKEIVQENKGFMLMNTYRWESELYAARLITRFRGIRFGGEFFLIGQYRMEGVCEKPFLFREDWEYKDVRVYGNPVVNRIVMPKEYWQITEEGRNFLSYKKEDFAEDSLETYCWVTVKYCTEEELRNGTIDLESDEILMYLCRDIPGEAG